jgi:hypothetical protein
LLELVIKEFCYLSHFVRLGTSDPPVLLTGPVQFPKLAQADLRWRTPARPLDRLPVNQTPFRFAPPPTGWGTLTIGATTTMPPRLD